MDDIREAGMSDKAPARWRQYENKSRKTHLHPSNRWKTRYEKARTLSMAIPHRQTSV